MMSNSRARFRLCRVALSALILAAAVTGTETSLAEDSPAPAIVPPTAAVRAPARVKIASVSVRPVTPAERLVATLVPETERSTLRDPVVVSVEVADAFTNLQRSSSPVIVLNGQPISDSIVPFGERNRVVALVRDGTRLEQPFRVQVGWLGDFERTLSEPVHAQVPR
jgi:hypothetical protein